LSGGMIFTKTPLTITLQADSPSIAIFEAWDSAQQANQAVYTAQMNVTLTSVGRSYQMITGFLVRGKRLPDAKKVLQPRKWRTEWQNVVSVPIGLAG